MFYYLDTPPPQSDRRRPPWLGRSCRCAVHSSGWTLFRSTEPGVGNFFDVVVVVVEEETFDNDADNADNDDDGYW